MPHWVVALAVNSLDFVSTDGVYYKQGIIVCALLGVCE